MIRHSFVMLAAAAALTIACNNKSMDASGVNANAGPRTQDSTMANSSAGKGMTSLSATDQQFVQEVAQGGRKEIELGRLAQQHGSNDSVKQLGQRVADDHERANRELESMLGSSDVARTSAPSDAARERLEKMSGDAFDRAYVEQLIEDHQNDITEFQRAAQSPNRTIRTFAEKTLPTLREHLQRARDAQVSLGSGR